MVEPSSMVEPAETPLLQLTDEELAVLGQGDGVVVAPYFAGLDERARETAQATALRGLMARDLVSRADDDGEPDSSLVAGGADADRAAVSMLLRHDLSSLLTLRRSAPVTVAVARTLGVATKAGAAPPLSDYWYAHVVEEFALLERVTPDGVHRFALARARDLVALTGAAVLHPHAADAERPPSSVRLPVPAGAGAVAGDLAVLTMPPALLAQLGEAHLRSDVVVVRRDADADGDADGGRPEMVGVFSGPAGCFEMSARQGAGELLLGGTTVAGLRGRIEGLVGGLAARAREVEDRNADGGAGEQEGAA